MSDVALIQVEVEFEAADKLVQDGFDTSRSYASDAVAKAHDFLTQIQTIGSSLATLPSVDVTLSPIASAITAFVAPPVPAEPAGLTVTLPAAPPAASVTAVTTFDPGTAPEFTEQAPAVIQPTVPGALQATVPVKPTLPDIAIPAAPGVLIPDVPTLAGFNIPGAPALNLPSFDATFAAAPTAPSNTFSFAETTYASSLLASLTTLLQSWVGGVSTGIDPAVEGQIWARARSRALATARLASEKVLRDFASRGFTKPPGALSIELQRAAQDAQDADIAQSREIAINQANLEQSNRRFAIEKAIQSEGQLMVYANNVAQRAFEAVKFAQQVAIDIFNGLVQLHQAEATVLTARAGAFKTQIDGELAKLDVYKGELEGQKLIGDLNLQQVEVYKARLAGVQAVIDIFKAQLDAANLGLSANKSLLEGFATEVTAFDSQVRAKASEYQIYETQWRGEAIKGEVFGRKVDAFKGLTQAFESGVNAKARAKEIEVKVNQDVPLQIHREAVETFKVLSEAETQRAATTARVLDARVQLFDAESRSEAARVGSETQVYKVAADVAIAQGNMTIEALKANLTALLQKINLLIEAARAGATVEAQLAASALASVSLSAGVHSTAGASLSSSESTNTSSSTNTSTSTNFNHSITGL